MPSEDWGVQATGFVRPTLEEIRDDRAASFRGFFGENQPIDPGSINGRLIDWVSEGMNLQFALSEGTYNSRYLSTVGLNGIDLLAEEYGFVRAAATYSTVTLTLGGTPGTVIPALSRVQTDSLDTWITTAGGVIGVGGTVDVPFRAETLGPVSAVSGTTWSILTPVTGWSTTTNALDAELGRNQQTAAELRAEIRRSLRGGLLRRSLLRLDGVTSCRVFENDTDTPDSLWNATHWVEAMVVGGTELDIVNVIALRLAPGITTFGTDSGTETISGFDETINYSRPIDTNVWIEVDITPGEGFDPADPAAFEDFVEEQLALWGDANHDPGDDVATEEIRSEVLRNVVGKVTLAVRVGTSNPPANTTIQTILDRRQAAFDTSRITCTIL